MIRPAISSIPVDRLEPFAKYKRRLSGVSGANVRAQLTKIAKLKISLGNLKLGIRVYTFSMPAGKEWTCPGETSVCERCYAKRGLFLNTSVQKRYKENYAAAMLPEFVPDMIHTVRAHRVQLFRKHVSGDYFDDAYVDKWRQILHHTRGTQYWAYTRSWQEESIVYNLAALAAMSNMQLWLSADRKTGRPPIIPYTRVAYMSVHDLDKPPYPCDLVFRDRPRTKQLFMNGNRVCPVENGTVAGSKLTCERCGLCWDQEKLVKLDYKLPAAG